MPGSGKVNMFVEDFDFNSAFFDREEREEEGERVVYAAGEGMFRDVNEGPFKEWPVKRVLGQR